MAYNKQKEIKVASVAGTPTISKAQPFKITNGDDTTTGTGDIVLDWANISSKADIAVYDQNDTLLDYYFESFDATAKTAVIWVYKDWVQDGSVQARIKYGNGLSDQSVVASTVFDKETNLQAGYLFNESSGDLLDVTSNNNDGTLYGGVTQGASGIVGGAYDFDGTDDYVTVPSTVLDAIETNNKFTFAASVNIDDLTSDRTIVGQMAAPDQQVLIWMDSAGDGTGYSIYLEDVDGNTIIIGNNLNTASANTWQRVVGTWDGSNLKIYSDGGLDASTSQATTIKSNNIDLGIGGDNNNLEANRLMDGRIDDLRIYSVDWNTDEIEADYSATKSSPTFFSQEAGVAVLTGNALFALNF